MKFAKFYKNMFLQILQKAFYRKPSRAASILVIIISFVNFLDRKVFFNIWCSLIMNLWC